MRSEHDIVDAGHDQILFFQEIEHNGGFIDLFIVTTTEMREELVEVSGMKVM